MSRLHREAMRVLIGEIASGVLAEGDRLPREQDLAEQFKVSRGVARECIRGLEERGLITVTHGRGATVAPAGEWDVFDPDVLSALLAGTRGREVLLEYIECRRILEVEAAGLAAERAGEEELKGLADAFAEMTGAAERARSNPAAEHFYQEADVAFHHAIVEATGNRALARMTLPIHRALSTIFAPLARPEYRFERGLPEHQRILEAIQSGDPEEARNAMREHLLTIEGYLRAAPEPVGPAVPA
jgi:GntR family transcriptional repressor for pyruvate dehydrogenase complex